MSTRRGDYDYALDFPTIKDWEDWYTEFKGEFAYLGSNDTNFDSFFNGLPDLTNFRNEMEVARNQSNGLKDSIVAKAIVEATKYAGPVKEAAYLVNKSYVTKALKWFDINRNMKEFTSWDADYKALMSELPSLDQVENYKLCAQKFRKDTELPKTPCFRVLTGEVLTYYTVNRRDIDTINELMKDMKQKRDKVAPGGANRNKEQSQANGDWVAGFVKGEISYKEPPVWGGWLKKNKNPGRAMLLCSTALQNAVSRRLITDDEIALCIQELEQMLETPGFDGDGLTMKNIIEAMKNFEQDKAYMNAKSAGGVGFQAQSAALDSVFSSFYWVWKSGATVDSFPGLAKFCHELGQRSVGKVKLTEVLSNTGWRWGKGLVNNMTKRFNIDPIHMHPAVLTAGRVITEMTACFGVVPPHEPYKAAEGCGSLRNLLNLETGVRNVCASAICDLFNVYKQGYPRYEDLIVPMEHMLHQSFLGKASPYQYAGLLDGDAFKIEIVPGQGLRGSEV
ncbi:nucleocapsid [Estero Real virus]|uniref:Nucleoprotein n=1 Tax=Estero Real virus TaxID=2170057 RepID=A0A346JIX4_9VIRU|nr:nucleocapsid [Estero Real virus]AXP33557.1 nucleocapsid [Estero Real virus]QLA46965.1 N [Estero Real virus] [Estero Real virus]